MTVYLYIGHRSEAVRLSTLKEFWRILPSQLPIDNERLECKLIPVAAVSLFHCLPPRNLLAAVLGQNYVSRALQICDRCFSSLSRPSLINE